MFYLLKGLLINTKEVQQIKFGECTTGAIASPKKIKILRVYYKNRECEDIEFETGKEAIEELENMQKKLNKPF